MPTPNVSIIYIMGAGRSGTTALATFLGNHAQIETLGEMHQFYEHLAKHLPTAHGQLLEQSAYWKGIVQNLPPTQITNAVAIDKQNKSIESHSRVLWHWLGIKGAANSQYLEQQEALFNTIQAQYPNTYLLDSAKYVGRYLALQKSKKLSFKCIYVVRDVRGVVWSFKKQVQTSTPPLRTVFYWLLVNAAAELVYRTHGKRRILKVRYEDLVNNPQQTFLSMGHFLQLNMQEVSRQTTFSMPDLVGGNRLRAQKKIQLSKDFAWQSGFTKMQKVFYFLLGLPFMLLNKYKV